MSYRSRLAFLHDPTHQVVFYYPRIAQRDEESEEDSLACGLKKFCSR